MALKEQQVFFCVCDGCGKNFYGYEEEYIPHFDTPDKAYEFVLDSDASVIAEDLRLKVLCYECSSPTLHERSLSISEIKASLASPSETKGEDA